MPLIAQTLIYANAFREQFGMNQNSTWNDMAASILIIRENDVTLEYTTMNNSVAVKQADVVLNTFPLDYTQNYPSSAALNDLDYVRISDTFACLHTNSASMPSNNRLPAPV
jgi:trehalose/maltose hydrolase-like predicted phosphorylase